MLLAVDIGNSYITLGGFNEDNLIFVSKVVTQTRNTEDQYAVELQSVMALHKVRVTDFTGAIISSVVPELTLTIKNVIAKLTGLEIMVVGPGLKSGLNILIDNPAQLGADLVAGAVAAISRYPMPCIIFDLGTATAASVIDKKGNFRGGVISAGVGTTLEALTSRTALLTNVSIEAPPSVIGKNSYQCMQSGLVYGTACLIEGLANKIELELGDTATLIATGGLAKDIVRHCNREILVCENLVLEGLRIIYLKNL